jgi:hypothetical protein
MWYRNLEGKALIFGKENIYYLEGKESVRNFGKGSIRKLELRCKWATERLKGTLWFIRLQTTQYELGLGCRNCCACSDLGIGRYGVRANCSGVTSWEIRVFSLKSLKVRLKWILGI